MRIKLLRYNEGHPNDTQVLGYFITQNAHSPIQLVIKAPEFNVIVRSIQRHQSYMTSKGLVSYKDGEKFLSVLPEIFKTVYLMAVIDE